MWKAAFATLIERKDLSLSGEQKMFYLQKYTTGEASNAIKSLFLIPSSESFNAAMDILKERFGSPSRVTSAFRRKLEAWHKISALYRHRLHEELQRRRHLAQHYPKEVAARPARMDAILQATFSDCAVV